MRHDLDAGSLVPLLESYAVEGRPISVVYPSARHVTSKVRALIDFLVEITRLPPEVEQRLNRHAQAVRTA
jgi:DNA-binding transcriptional LysR family regulator